MRAVGEPACGKSIEALGYLQRPGFAGINVSDVHARRIGISDELSIGRYRRRNDGRLAGIRGDALLGD